MSALEQEIYKKFEQLDDNAKQRVLQHLTTNTRPFDFDTWLNRVRSTQETIRLEKGTDYEVNVVKLLREVREEEG